MTRDELVSSVSRYKMHLTPQQTQILQLLSDLEFHCPMNELFMKDDRKRFSELRDLGFIFVEGVRCEIPEHRHKSKPYLRKLLTWPSSFDLRTLTFKELVFGITRPETKFLTYK